jgi:FtsH-binding integral membrane protein
MKGMDMHNVILLMFYCLVLGSTLTLNFLTYRELGRIKISFATIISVLLVLLAITMTLTDLHRALQCYPLR